MSNRIKRIFANLAKQQLEITPSVDTEIAETDQIGDFNHPTSERTRNSLMPLVDAEMEVLERNEELLPQGKLDESRSNEEVQSINNILLENPSNNYKIFTDISAEAIMTAPIIFSGDECEPTTSQNSSLDLTFTDLSLPVHSIGVTGSICYNWENMNAHQTEEEKPERIDTEFDRRKNSISNILDKNCEESEISENSDEEYVPHEESDEERNDEVDNIIRATHLKSRKRSRNKENWPRSIRKKQRNLGKSYLTSKKKLVAERSLQEPCTNACRQKCTLKVSDITRSEILTSFWSLGDVSKQRQFICNHTEDIMPRYRYIKENSQRQNSTKAYYLHVNNEKVRVCKKYFMSTLNIGDTMIRTALKKSDDNKIVGPDLRGKHGNHKKLAPSLKDGVRKHFESLPTVESHYLRQQTERSYIEGNLTLATLYRDYKRECEESGKPFVKACIYEQIFNFEYNIGWHKPKKDQCSLCERFANSSSEEKQILQSEFDKHVADKNRSREEKQRDVSDASVDKNKLVAVYDLQAVLSTPCAEVSDFYYKSKLATYNFTIFNIHEKEGYCYVWSENVARRGANEIGSCLLHFLEGNCKEKQVTFYSDNCAGQNKNKYIFSLYLYATTFLQIPVIRHKFLVTGHTQNEGDSMHSCIEKEKKRVLKGGPIYIPAQWIPVIQGAKKKGKPYRVKEMDQSEFFDLQKLSSDMGKNFALDTEKKKVKWTEIKEIMAMASQPNSLFFKYEFGQDIPYSEIRISNNISLRSSNRNLRIGNQFTGKLSPAYSTELKISKQKKDGLIALCQKNLIPKPYQDFYKNLASD